MSYRIVIPDDLNPEALAVLRAKEGVDVHAPGKMTREQTLAAVPEADALIIRSGTTVDRDLLAAASRLKVIARAGVGVDNVDLAACTAQGIVVMNTPGGNTIATAELALGLLLALLRHIPQADASVRAGRWDRKAFVGTELAGKTVGIIGFGRVGRAFSQRIQGFDVKEVAYDPFVPEHVARHLGLSLVALDELLACADFISLHAHVTDETRGLINKETIAKMKDGVYIVNVARGVLVNSADLADAIKSGKVAGAAIDVYDQEPPPPDNPLLNLPNVIYTPHLGASSNEAQVAVGVQAAELVIDALFKRKYDNVRNKDVLEKLM